MSIGFWRATGNYLVVGISIIILFIDLIMIGFTSRKQELHNLVSRTIHLKDNKHINYNDLKIKFNLND